MWYHKLFLVACGGRLGYLFQKPFCYDVSSDLEPVLASFWIIRNFTHSRAITWYRLYLGWRYSIHRLSFRWSGCCCCKGCMTGADLMWTIDSEGHMFKPGVVDNKQLMDNSIWFSWASKHVGCFLIRTTVNLSIFLANLVHSVQKILYLHRCALRFSLKFVPTYQSFVTAFGSLAFLKYVLGEE